MARDVDLGSTPHVQYPGHGASAMGVMKLENVARSAGFEPTLHAIPELAC